MNISSKIHTPIHRHIVTSRVINRFSQKERLALALAYLKNNPNLTVKQYVKITSLGKEAAEAEPDAFAQDRNIRFIQLLTGKRNFM